MTAIKIPISILLGYLLGSLSPAALISKLKKSDLRTQGTKNLGASNTLLTFGKAWGALVMLFDIAKAYLAYKLAQWICPAVSLIGMLAGSAAVVGHIFPFYLKFKGGKGLAAYGGLVLACDPMVFCGLLVLATILIIVTNHSSIMPMTAAVLFPILLFIRTQSIPMTVIAALISALMAWKHRENLMQAIRNEDLQIRKYIKENIFHH